MHEVLAQDGPMSDLDYYLLEDHAARRKTTFICMLLGIAVGTTLQAVGSSIRVTAILTLGVVAAVELVMAVTYKRTAIESSEKTPTMLLRRTLLQSALYALA